MPATEEDYQRIARANWENRRPRWKEKREAEEREWQEKMRTRVAKWQARAMKRERGKKKGKEKDIYFVEGADLIKIGISEDAEKRFKKLQAENAVPLTLLGCIRGDVYREKALHEKFAHLRSHGEWFQATDELREYIRDLLADV